MGNRTKGSKNDRRSERRIVVFTGAGVSADSGISTFRDSDGLWANYRIEDVCTPEALENNRETVIEFYNIRRKELFETDPNPGHYAIAELEKHFDVEVVTQNVDDLHERAGSTRVTHLHGELTKLRSCKDDTLIVELDYWEQCSSATAPDGALLRPHIVFFGESVPMFQVAAGIVAQSDILVIVGTSLAVYPAAALVRYISSDVPVYIVDPGNPDTSVIANEVKVIAKKSAVGMPELAEYLIGKYVK